MSAAIVYVGVPAEVSHVTAYEWRAGSRPASIDIIVSRQGAAVTVSLLTEAAVVVQFSDEQGRYLLDGPFRASAARVERIVERTWRRTIAGRADRPVFSGAPMTWLATGGTTGAVWPACWWVSSETWECLGVEVGAAGVVVAQSGSMLWSGVAGTTSATILQPSAWGRLIAVRDRAGDPLTGIRLVAARPAAPSAQRVEGVRLDTARIAGVRVASIASGVLWVAGDLSPPDAWLEIRTTRSGPAFPPLADVADGSWMVPVDVLLDRTRKVRVTVTSDRDIRVAGAMVTAFRLIDPIGVARTGADKPPRRVFASEGFTDAQGVAEVDAGDAQYELVAWHPQLGKGAAVLESGSAEIHVRLRSPGLARGRVLGGGQPAGGVNVIAVPDPAAYAAAEDPMDVKGGDARTGGDGRFAVALAPGGGGELRVGGGTYPIKRVPLPRAGLPLVDLGDIELGHPLALAIVLDRDPGCDLRAVGPVGRAGLQIVNAVRTGPGIFTVTVPEEGDWEIGLLCGRQERELAPGVVHVSAAAQRNEVRVIVR